MPIERSLYKALTADTELRRLLAGRIYPVRIPQGTLLPALVYQQVSNVPYNHMGAGYGLSRVRVRLDVWALNYAEAKDIAGAAKAAVATASGFDKMIESCGPDWGDDETFRTSVDIVCWEKEGFCYE